MIRTLIAALLLALPLLPLDTEPYGATLTSPWGTATAKAGLATLDFEQRTQRPVLFLSVERGFAGMVLDGQIDVSSVVTTETGMTLTGLLAEEGPDTLFFTSTCSLVEVPVGAGVDVTGRLTTVRCPPEQTGCGLVGVLTRIGNVVCP